MSRLIFPLLFLYVIVLLGCAAPVEVTVQPTATEMIAMLPTETATTEPTVEPTAVSPTMTPLPPIETATSQPTATSTAVSPTAIPMPPTPTSGPASIAAMVEGDCLALERPFTYIRVDSTHQFESLITGEQCVLETIVENGSFEVSLVEPTIGLYGALISNTQAEQIRVDFDGSIHNLNIEVGPFWAGRLHMISSEQHIAWGEGYFNPDNEDEFIAQLIMADSDGQNPKVIYEHITDLPEKLLPEIFFPIGFHPNGDILFSIEPAGRGGGWFYTGDSTNLYRTSLDSAEKTEDDLVFTCPDSPFCIGDFTDDFSHFVAADFWSKSIFIIDLEIGEEVWRSVEDRSFVGRPIFNEDKDLAYVAVDVIDEGNYLRPESGYIAIIDFPYDGDAVQLEAELASDLLGWIDDETILYLELDITSSSDRERRYSLINRTGEPIGVWQTEIRLRGIYQ